MKMTATFPAQTCTLIGLAVSIGGAAFCFLSFPFIFRKIVAHRINLGEGTDSRRSWIRPPPLDFNVYVFNISNPAAVMQGAKPTLREVGPYCFREMKEKTILEEDLVQDTITYKTTSTWYWNQKAGVCQGANLTGDELLIIPNVPLLSVLKIARKDYPTPFLALVNLALPSLFGAVQDVFLRASARKLLFEGVLVDCSTLNPLAIPVCINLRRHARALRNLGGDRYSFSFFGAKNGSLEGESFTVMRGTLDVREVGRIVAVNERRNLTFWRGQCNQLHGTDASVFPPFREPQDKSLTVFSSDVCRVMYGKYEGDHHHKGILGYMFSADLGDSEHSSVDRCFCPTDDGCYKTGVLDAFNCQGAPLVSSLPHFYKASPDYVQAVRGLHPDKRRHGILIVLEPTSGVPLLARKRIQMNIDLEPIPFTPVTRGLVHTLVPLFWAEEILELDDDLTNKLRTSLLLPVRVVHALKWTCVASSCLLAVYLVIMRVRKYRRDRVQPLEHPLEYFPSQKHPRPPASLKYLEYPNTTHPFSVSVS